MITTKQYPSFAGVFKLFKQLVPVTDGVKKSTAAFAFVSLFVCGLAQAQMNVSVEGNGLDIRPLQVDTPLYATGVRADFSFSKDNPHMVTEVSSFLAAQYYAAIAIPPGNEIRTDYKLTRVKADATGILYIGVANPSYSLSGWERVPGTFKTRSKTYYRYRFNYNSPNTWVTLPNASSATGGLPVVVYGEKSHIKFNNPLPIPGTVVETVAKVGSRATISNVSMEIMPNGDYIANFSSTGGSPTYRSRDKGVSWTLVSRTPFKMSFQSIFENNGKLYVLGRSRSDENAPVPEETAVIYQSSNGGASWVGPVYLPFEIAGGVGRDSAPARMVKVGGRLYRAAQIKTDGVYGAGIISISAAADLLNPSNWSATNSIAVPKSTWISSRGTFLKTMDEGDTLVTREGRVMNISKTASSPGGTGVDGAAKITYINRSLARFDPARDFINLPGGGSKFSIRYDSVSDKYWALTSTGLNRSRLDLFSSTDLKNFVFEKTILSGKSNYFHGHNYPYMHIEGNDIVFVLRHGFESEAGQAERWHDATHMTFHRIRNFRSAVAATAYNR